MTMQTLPPGGVASSNAILIANGGYVNAPGSLYVCAGLLHPAIPARPITTV